MSPIMLRSDAVKRPSFDRGYASLVILSGVLGAKDPFDPAPAQSTLLSGPVANRATHRHGEDTGPSRADYRSCFGINVKERSL